MLVNGSDGTEEDAKMEMTFSSLKHYCMDLLDLLRNPRTSAPFLPEMADFLRSSPAESLQPSLEYTAVFGGAFEEMPFGICGSDSNFGVSHVFHVKTAEIEAARGHHGSAKLRSEALLTLRVFVAKVGTADALAFFLPGVVSRFAKILHVSKGMVSGAAGSVGSVDHSVRGLTEFLVTVLRDEENLFYLDLSMEEVDGFCAHKDGSTQSILESLRKLPVNDRSLAKMEIDQMTGGLLPKPFPSENAHSRDNAESLAVNRTKDWIHETTSHVDKLLSATFPHECLCVLAYDDSELVSVAAQESLETLFMLREQYLSENEVAEIFNRLIEKLPKLVLGSEERIVVSHAQKLLAVMYYAGPENVVDHLLRSSLTAVRSLDYLTLSLSPNSLFAGSVDKLITLKPLSSGYLHSISELRAGAHLSCAHSSIVSSAPSSFSLRQCKSLTNHIEILHKDYELPRMPPWLADDSQKLYQSLAGILRHIGLSLLADQSANIYEKLFHKSGNKMKEVNIKGGEAGIGHVGDPGHTAVMESVWNVYQRKDARSHVIDCVGSILHEYLSSEIWDLASDQKSFLLAQDMETENLSPHFFRDIANLHQNLICSNYQIRSASDVVLRVLSASSDFPTVGHLVLANSDYIIDSLCRQLRHLDLNPHVPDVLGSMLSYIGAAHKILPLLEEPMRIVSSELEVLGRHQHPDLIIPFLKAVLEIAKSCKREALLMPNNAQSLFKHVKSKVVDSETKAKENHIEHIDISEVDSLDSEAVYTHSYDAGELSENWEELLFKLHELKSYRRTIGSVSGSCIIASTPLLASTRESACLLALETVEDGITILAKVEEAYKCEKDTKELIQRANVGDSGIGDTPLWIPGRLMGFTVKSCYVWVRRENPAEQATAEKHNEIWGCKFPLKVVMRSLGVVSSIIQICGGDFFTRRFHQDGPTFWKILTTSPFQRRPTPRGERPLLLPYRTASISSEDSMSELSTVKVQAAALNMIFNLSSNKRSASALEAVLKKVSGLVVGIACSGVKALRDASLKALSGLACIDPDLVWILLADVYYTVKKDFPSPLIPGLAEVSEILPPPSSSKEYLYRQYGGESFGFDIDEASVEPDTLKALPHLKRSDFHPQPLVAHQRLGLRACEAHRGLRGNTTLSLNPSRKSKLYDQGLSDFEKLERHSTRDRIVLTKITQSFIPAVSWTVWLTINATVFKNHTPYLETMWEGVKVLIKTWAIHCARAKRITFKGEQYEDRELERFYLELVTETHR
ncbi:hypothetical protein QJS04_geneDACA023079 [Acorus gramineus]|uniref:Uncharacterized protein n=1 Tax=Acorus gramineus TaxID=55184 RepID=A0AAV9BPA8_ACOGR|nr:hypothetical protein QJS04_geneDACA023079 [Acorus gramineus]